MQDRGGETRGVMPWAALSFVDCHCKEEKFLYNNLYYYVKANKEQL